VSIGVAYIFGKKETGEEESAEEGAKED